MLPIPIGNHVALRFDEFFHGIFKTPQITNVNLIVAGLLVESNTMSIEFHQLRYYVRHGTGRHT